MGVLLNIIGASIFAHLSYDIMAASTLAFSIFALIGMFLYGTLYSLGIIVGKAYGEGDYPLIGQTIRTGCFLSFILASASILFLWHISFLLKLLHQQQEIIQPTQEILRSLSLRYLPMLLFVVFNQYVMGVKKPKIITICGLINLLFGIPLSYTLSYGTFGFPNIGIWGVGVANSISATIQFLVIFTYTATNRDFAKFCLFSDKFNKSPQLRYSLVKILRTGVPIGLQYVIEISALGISSFMFGYFSIDALSAQQISFQFTSQLLLIASAISESVSILIGHAYGCKNKQAINQYARIALLFGMTVTIFMGGIICVFPMFFIKIYMGTNIHQNSILAHTIITFLIISMSTQLFDSARNISLGILRGIFDIKIPMLINVLTCWLIALPLSYILSFSCHFGPIGIKYGWFVAILIGYIILYARYHLLYMALWRAPHSLG